MRKLIFYFMFFFLFFNLKGNSDEIYPVKENFEEVFNIGAMLSHDDKFTLYFRTREKAVLARGEEFNYITDYPQDLYIMYNATGNSKPLITYDWFPKKVKELGSNYNLASIYNIKAKAKNNVNSGLSEFSNIKTIENKAKLNNPSKAKQSNVNQSKAKPSQAKQTGAKRGKAAPTRKKQTDA